jgi:hypothetical protein
MLHCVALVRTDFSEEISNRRTLRRNTKYNIPEEAILHSQLHENHKSDIE